MNQFIDHTHLAPDCTGEDVDRICQEAREHGFYAVCIPPFFVGRAKKSLQGSTVKVSTVISYPYGYDETPIKVQAIRRALEEGADELDVVINLAAVRSGDWAYVLSDLSAINTTTRLKSKITKFIVEMSELDAGERRKVCDICNEVKPSFVKTSTGTRGGATVEDVRFLREHLLPEIKIKASGGIRNRTQAEDLIAAGADRLGTSAGIAVVTVTAG